MSNGEQEILFNPQEKALSSDLMRLQRFRSLDFNEYARVMMDSLFASEDSGASATLTQFDAQESPLRAEIMGGLLVRPAVGSKDLTVDSGLAFVIDTESVSNTDESPYKYIRDPGVPLPGTLQIDVSTNGGTRIDVIECARVTGGVFILETDNRDVFNSTTGLFNATSVNKVQAGRLRYRVRKGADGAGFPGTVAGWLPLCVASIPNGSTTNDTVTFWDVRPLVTDRVNAPFNLPTTDATNFPESQINGRTLTAVTGLLRAQYKGRRIGGILRQGTPHTGGAEVEESSIDVTSVDNKELGFVTVASQPWNLYMCFPFGLPRWARYLNPLFAPRIPRSPCGIPVVSMKTMRFDGTPTAAIALPAGTGLTGSTSNAVCVASGYCDGGATMRGVFGDNTTGQFLDILGGGGIVIAPFTADATQVVYKFDGALNFPSAAKAILVQFKYVMTATATAVTFVSGSLAAPDTGAGAAYNPGGFLVPGVRYNVGDGCETRFAAWLAVPQNFPRSGASGGFQSFSVTVVYGGSNITFNSAQATILGWRF